MFKRFKQNFAMTQIKAGSSSYAETEVLLWLILWTMTEKQAFLTECCIAEKEKRRGSYSVYETSKINFLQIKEILCLSWSLFVNLSEEKYFRYLSGKKRRRSNQNEIFHMVILPGLLA